MIERHIEDIENLMLSHGRSLPSYFSDPSPRVCQITTFTFSTSDESNGNTEAADRDILKQILDSPPPVLKSSPEDEGESKGEDEPLKDYVKLCLGHKYLISKNQCSASPSVEELEEAYQEKKSDELELEKKNEISQSNFQRAVQKIICAATEYSNLQQLYKFHGTVNTNTITPSIQTISFNKNGELFIAGGTMRYVRVYEFNNMIKAPQNLAPYVNSFDCQHRIFSSCFSPVDDAVFITGNSNGELTWFDSIQCMRKSMDNFVSSTHSPNHAVFSLDWSPCFKNVLASVAADSILKLWDINVSKPIVKSLKIKVCINGIQFEFLTEFQYFESYFRNL